MKTAFPGIDVSVVYAFLLFTMKSAIMFSAILSLCRFGDHVLTFSRLHGNDSGGSVGLRSSDFLRLFFFIYSFIYLFYFISFCFIFFLFYAILCYFILFLFIYFFIRTTHPKSGNAFDAKWKRNRVALLPLSMCGIFLVAILNSAVSWCEAWN